MAALAAIWFWRLRSSNSTKVVITVTVLDGTVVVSTVVIVAVGVPLMTVLQILATVENGGK